MPPAPDDLERQMAVLRAGYARQLPEKVQTIEAAYEAFAGRAWESEACSLAYRRAHSLAGSSGTYGFSELGHAARSLELVLKSSLERGTALVDAEKKRALEIIASLKAMASQAAAGAPQG